MDGYLSSNVLLFWCWYGNRTSNMEFAPMTIQQTNTFAKIAAVVAGLGLVAMSFAFSALPPQKPTTASTTQP